MHITTLFIWFFLYSILGWVYETIYCTTTNLKWDNRGMLIGPYCPIYGVGAVLDVLVCETFPSRGIVFFVCMAGSAFLEYITSYTTEQLFHAVWWSYMASILISPGPLTGSPFTGRRTGRSPDHDIYGRIPRAQDT